MNFKTISRDYPLILASASPRRKHLLRQIDLPFRPLSSKIEEKEGIDEPPAVISITSHGTNGHTCLLAEKKARTVRSKSGESWILGADTIVVCEDIILGKPGSHDEARSMLLLLKGKEHKVITGFCLLDPSNRLAHKEENTTLVKMKELTDDEIDAYIATDEPFGKAGSYAIQGVGSFMVEAISGSYTNVVGLPLCALIKSLLSTGALKRFPLLSYSAGEQSPKK